MSPWSLLLSGVNNPSVLQSSDHLYGPSLHLVSQVHVFPVLSTPHGCSTPGGVSSEGQNCLS